MTVSRHGVTITFDQLALFDRLAVSVAGVVAFDRAYPTPLIWDRALYELEREGLEEWQLEMVEDVLGGVL